LQEALLLLGIQRDMNLLLNELDQTHDGVVSFDEFIQWWRQHVNEARVVVVTSAAAWKRVLKQSPPEGFGDIILLEVTFTFCKSCRSFHRKFHRLSERYSNVRFVQLVGNATIGASALCTAELGVKVSPAFFVFRRGGELLARWNGANVERFVQRLEACLETEKVQAQA